MNLSQRTASSPRWSNCSRSNARQRPNTRIHNIERVSILVPVCSSSTRPTQRFDQRSIQKSKCSRSNGLRRTANRLKRVSLRLERGTSITHNRTTYVAAREISESNLVRYVRQYRNPPIQSIPSCRQIFEVANPCRPVALRNPNLRRTNIR